MDPPDPDELIPAEELVERLLVDDVPESAVDVAFLVSCHLLSHEFGFGEGVLYRDHAIVRSWAPFPTFSVVRDGRVLDVAVPSAFPGARALAEYLDRITGAEVSHVPPVHRQRDRQRGGLN